MSTVQQKIGQPDQFDAIMRNRIVAVIGDDNFFVIVPNLAKRRKLPLSCDRIVHGFRYLNITLLACVSGDKVHFPVSDLANRHIVSTAEQLKIIKFVALILKNFIFMKVCNTVVVVD